MPDKTFEEIRDALIRCNGNEPSALEGLLTGELPKRKIPSGKIKRKVKKIKKVKKLIKGSKTDQGINNKKY